MRAPLLFLFLLLHLTAGAQRLNWNGVELRQPQPEKLPEETTARRNLLRSVREELQEKGFWTAGWEQRGDTLTLFPGPVFSWRHIHWNLPPEQVAGTDAGATASLPDHPVQVARASVTYLENHGHPFAEVRVDSVRWTGSEGEVWLSLDPGPEVKLHRIIPRGYTRFPEALVRYGLGLRPGNPYNEQLIRELPDRLDRLPFLAAERPAAVLFGQDSTLLYLYLKRLKNNRFDGLIGLNTEAGEQAVLTGQVDLRLLNLLGFAEEVSLHWQRPNAGWQSLKLDLHTPYWFNSPVGLHLGTELYLQDSSFLNTRFKARLTWQLGLGQEVYAGIDRRVSSTLGETVTGFKDVNTFLYTVGGNFTSLRPYTLPVRGSRFSLELGTGERTASGKTNRLNEVQGNYLQHIYLGRRHNLVAEAGVQLLLSDSLAANELYRPGGLATVRGFNEQAFYSSHLARTRLEYRFFLDPMTYLLFSADLAYLENRAALPAFTQQALGLATGMSFRTNAGQFQLILAIGRTDSQPFDLRASKVHIGYSSSF